ncbi:MAG: hypothetical protein J6T10_32350 [Methanobrevibacter sp.]|nr:hypothetical protein [Methanobrevibacter sp.]
MKENYNFIDDSDKMKDLVKLSKKDFLESYSYLTEEEYDETAKLLLHKCLENYHVITVKDLCDDIDYGKILLNKRHTMQEFENAIDGSKKRHAEEIAEYGDDFEYIFGDEKLNEKIDYEWLEISEKILYM